MNDLVPNVTINGKVWIDGEDIYDPKVDTTLLRKKVGMVFQQPNPFPMSIYDNIAYGPRIHGIKGKAELDAIVEKSLRGAALWDEVKRFENPHNYYVDLSQKLWDIKQDLLRKNYR